MSGNTFYEGGKRERLIAAARDVIYRQGYGPTTLAHVAEASGVPLGNVYYYFKTKDALVEAVIETRLEQVRSQLEAAERRAHAAARIA
ncbi:MAG: TetR/AcrR family transcriptional regulator, partial [Thermoanaerobaculia bacterium]|nr:TetR/AcrR family transcriptional regulator [Thermoanaerobaculia bacterium]